MKSFVATILVLPQLAFANVCNQVSPLAKQYNEQQSWETIELESSETPVKMNALIDDKGQLILDKTLFRGDIEAKIEADLSRKQMKFFKYYCHEDPDKDALSGNRRLGKNNSFRLKLKYLPNVEGLSVDPYEQLKNTSYEVMINYSSNSGVEQDYKSHKVKRMIEERINEELNSQKVIGEYDIDLKNLDDFVCDLLDGSAQISILNKMVNSKAIVEKEEGVPADELIKLYNQWVDLVGTSSSYEMVFVAGMGFERLKSSGEINHIDISTAYKALDKAFNPTTKKLAKFNRKEKQCFVDSMTDYHQADSRQLINLNLKFDMDKFLAGE